MLVFLYAFFFNLFTYRRESYFTTSLYHLVDLLNDFEHLELNECECSVLSMSLNRTLGNKPAGNNNF